MPIRKIPKNHRNVTGVAAASKASGAAQFESTLERDFLALLEFSPEVERFEAQPVKIEWRDEQGEPRKYTPDVLVEFKADLDRPPWLCEVKYRADIKKDWTELHPRFLRGIRLARQNNWRFRLISEVEIRTPLLTNVRFLSSFRSRSIPASDTDRILACLQSLDRTTPAGLLNAFLNDTARQAEWLPAIWHLMARHQIGVDLERELKMDSPIWNVS